MTFDSKVIKRSRKVHICTMCLTKLPAGSMYITIPNKDDDGKFSDIKMCAECAYLMQHASCNKFKEGGFAERNLPNCLRKIRTQYRKNPIKAWEEMEKK